MSIIYKCNNFEFIVYKKEHYIRFSKYNWSIIGIEGTYILHGPRCLLLEEEYKKDN